MMMRTTTRLLARHSIVLSRRRGLGWNVIRHLAWKSTTPSLFVFYQNFPPTGNTNAVSSACFSTAASSANNNNDNNRIPFLLADIGEGIKEVELLQWYVQPGDTVQQFDRVCEVQSDKATVEITSRYDGVVTELAGNVGDMMQVGSPLLYLQTSGAAHDDDTSGALEEEQAEQQHRMLEDTETKEADERLQIPTIASQYHLYSDDDFDDAHVEPEGKFLASPAVRKLGKEYNLDLSTIHGTGPHGRLLKSDVLVYLRESGRIKSDQDLTAMLAHPTPAQAAPPSAATTKEPAKLAAEQDEIFKLKGYNRLMINTMTASLQIPHMCFADELEVGRLLECRKELQQDGGHHWSILTFLLKACSLALLEYPTLNAVVHNLENAELMLRHDHDLGIAMDTPRGLVVPVIRQVQKKTLEEIQAELVRLKQLAQDSKLAPQDLENPTFTLSNIGSMGGTYMQPVIVPPQLAMGAVGQIQTLPRFDANQQVYAAQVVHVSWAGDHRFLDGATLARFNAKFKHYTENPIQMLAHLK